MLILEGGGGVITAKVISWMHDPTNLILDINKATSLLENQMEDPCITKNILRTDRRTKLTN